MQYRSFCSLSLGCLCNHDFRPCYQHSILSCGSGVERNVNTKIITSVIVEVAVLAVGVIAVLTSATFVLILCHFVLCCFFFI